MQLWQPKGLVTPQSTSFLLSDDSLLMHYLFGEEEGEMLIFINKIVVYFKTYEFSVILEEQNPWYKYIMSK